MALQLNERWADHAACKGFRLEHGTEEWTKVWFPAIGTRQEQIRRAKAVCNTCTVRTSCLEYSYQAGIKIGIWGGLTEYERRKHRRAWHEGNDITYRSYKGKLAPCGSYSAYRRHHSRGEMPCDECKTAYSEYRAKARAKKRGER